MRFSRENNKKISCFLCRMILEWREREHGDVDEVVQGDLWPNKLCMHVACISFGVLEA